MDNKEREKCFGCGRILYYGPDLKVCPVLLHIKVFGNVKWYLYKTSKEFSRHTVKFSNAKQRYTG